MGKNNSVKNITLEGFEVNVLSVEPQPYTKHVWYGGGRGKEITTIATAVYIAGTIYHVYLSSTETAVIDNKVFNEYCKNRYDAQTECFKTSYLYENFNKVVREDYGEGDTRGVRMSMYAVDVANGNIISLHNYMVK